MIILILHYLILYSLKLFAQEINISIIDTIKKQKMLIWLCNREAFEDSAFKFWFDESYNNYQLDYKTIDKLDNKLDSISITIVMGTWCSDSKEQIPAFYKILDELNCDSNSITLINVDRNKKGLSNEIKKLNIELIPTIIFYKQRKKIGRIIETPYESLEKDLINITNNWYETF